MMIHFPIYLAFLVAVRESVETTTDVEPETQFCENLRKEAAKMEDPTEKSAMLAYIGRTEKQINDIKGDTDSLNYYTNVKGAVSTVVSSWDDLTSDDPGKTFNALMNIGNSLSNFVPDPFGAAIGSISTIFTALLGKTQPTMTEVIEAKLDGAFTRLYGYLDGKFDKLQEQLTGIQLQSLRAEYEGAKVTIQTMAAIMQGLKLSGRTLSDGDINFLHSQVSATSGLRVVGMLKAMISNMILTVKSTSRSFYLDDTEMLNDVKEIYEIIRLYAELSNLRKILLAEARDIYANSNITVGSEYAIRQVIAVNLQYDKSLFDFMVNPKSGQEWFVVSNYNLEDKFLNDFLNAIDLHPLKTNRNLKNIMGDTGCVKLYQKDGNDLEQIVYRTSDCQLWSGRSNGYDFNLRVTEEGSDEMPLFNLIIPSCNGNSSVPVCQKPNWTSNLLRGIPDSSCQFMFIRHHAAGGIQGNEDTPYSYVILNNQNEPEVSERRYPSSQWGHRYSQVLNVPQTGFRQKMIIKKC